MATISISTSAPCRARLAAMPGVTVFDRPLPKDPTWVALVMAGVRNYVVRAEGNTFAAAFHIRSGEYLQLATGTTLNAAYAAVAEHLACISHLSPAWSAETEAAERRAAAAVLAGDFFNLPVAA
jgi:hypothetical protein